MLNTFDTRYPEFKDQGFEVAGFVWFQGHKDTGSDVHASRYEQNMANDYKAVESRQQCLANIAVAESGVECRVHSETISPAGAWGTVHEE